MGRLFRDGTNPVWGGFVLVFVVAALGLDFYWLIVERGPVGWLAGVQARWFDGHWYPKITLLGVLLVEVIGLLVIKAAIERLTGKRLTR